MIIHWLGQACFLISLLTGTHVLIDPPHPQVGYHVAAHSIPAGLVFVSHEHPDHNYIQAVKGPLHEVAPLAASTPYAVGAYVGPRPQTVTYRRIAAYHDNAQGLKRGPDTITVLHADGLSVCHLGDLGQLMLTP